MAKTVQSLLNQQNEGYHVYVVYTDAPLQQIRHERISYVALPFGYASIEQIPEHAELLSQFKTEKMVERRWDKGMKVTYGSALAIEAGCHYVMSLDSDDLVSAQLVQYVQDHHEAEMVPGWIIDKGYIYKKGGKSIQVVNGRLHFLNGSTAVLHRSLLSLPDLQKAKYLEINLFTDHAWIYERIKQEQNKVLQFIPFPAVVYMVHANNASQIGKIFGGLSLKSILKRLLYGRPLTKSIKEEFAISYLLLSALF